MRQEEIVKQHLLDHGSITPVEARAVYKIQDVSKRISVLKQEKAMKKHGKKISRVLKTDATGTRYARYFLEDLKVAA